MAEHNEFGIRGEEVAVAHLIGKGYSIVERNWRCGHKEVDIIAMKDSELVFVEVKTRKDEEVSRAMEAVDAGKRRRIVQAADAYVRMQRLDMPVRFDIITVVGKERDFVVDHIEDAFHPQVLTPGRRKMYR